MYDFSFIFDNIPNFEHIILNPEITLPNVLFLLFHLLIIVFCFRLIRKIVKWIAFKIKIARIRRHKGNPVIYWDNTK